MGISIVDSLPDDSQTSTLDGVTQTPEPTPFSFKVRKTPWRVSLQEALAAAEAAGYKPTARSKPNRIHVQRRWNEGAAIRPMPGDTGVVIRPAWTTAQMWVVAGILFLLFFGWCLLGSALSLVGY